MMNARHRGAALGCLTLGLAAVLAGRTWFAGFLFGMVAIRLAVELVLLASRPRSHGKD